MEPDRGLSQTQRLARLFATAMITFMWFVVVSSHFLNSSFPKMYNINNHYVKQGGSIGEKHVFVTNRQQAYPCAAHPDYVRF
jgi:hypothetical protein